MKFRIECKHAIGKDTWWETYDENTDDPVAWAERTVDYFNKTLRPGEEKRVLLRVEVIDADARKHDWFKETAGMSVKVPGRSGVVDLMRCSKCGITGKRLGLKSGVLIDSKFKRKAYRECHTSVAYQAELRALD